jgi:hypothetical protein
LFRNPPVILKIVPKAGYDVRRKNSVNESKGKLEQKFDAVYGTIFRIRCLQKKQAKTSLEQDRLKI